MAKIIVEFGGEGNVIYLKDGIPHREAIHLALELNFNRRIDLLCAALGIRRVALSKWRDGHDLPKHAVLAAAAILDIPLELVNAKTKDRGWRRAPRGSHAVKGGGSGAAK
jgi:hypothetical protein